MSTSAVQLTNNKSWLYQAKSLVAFNRITFFSSQSLLEALWTDSVKALEAQKITMTL